jgi:predicted nuclease of restriction endonuclease-like (RecB) superfamily
MPSQSSKNFIQNSEFVDHVKSLIMEGQRHIVRNINAAMLITYYQIGRRIIEEEQHGRGRAEYGLELLINLSKELSADFGRGYSVDNLQYMRKFYLTYSKYETLSRISSDSIEPISETLSRISGDLFKLSWSHYIQLMKVSTDEERKFYEIEATQNNWSLRELKRQYHSSLYERLSLSRDKKGVSELAKTGQIIEKPTDALKTPYVLEFLELKEDHRYSENELEAAIINKLEHSMLELGKGFLFAGRQRRFTMEGNHFYVDLVFYNRLLKCFVLFDLKIGELTHQDIGQMQMYVNYYDRVVKTSEENQTIGIILCKEDNKTIIEFTLPEGNKQIFSREYKLYLPSKEELKKQLE